MVLQVLTSESAAEHGGEFDEAGLALPGLGVEQFRILLFGEALFCTVFFVAGPFVETLSTVGGDAGEVGEARIAEFARARGAEVFVAGSEAHALNGLEGELAVQVDRAPQ